MWDSPREHLQDIWTSASLLMNRSERSLQEEHFWVNGDSWWFKITSEEAWLFSIKVVAWIKAGLSRTHIISDSCLTSRWIDKRVLGFGRLYWYCFANPGGCLARQSYSRSACRSVLVGTQKFGWVSVLWWPLPWLWCCSLSQLKRWQNNCQIWWLSLALLLLILSRYVQSCHLITMHWP